MEVNQMQNMISSFLEITFGQTIDTAEHYLHATNWNLQDAIQLFYSGGGAIGSNGEEDELRAPLPIVTDTLYDGDTSILYGLPRNPTSVIPFRNFDEETNLQQGAGNSATATSAVAASVGNSRVNLASMYRPPFRMIFNGSFEKAKSAGSDENKWLLVNLQSPTKFNSYMLNRDTWGNKTVSETVSNYFIFFQVEDDSNEGRKISSYYKLYSAPVVMVIDPITGQKMRSWSGMVQPESLLEYIIEFMDGGPRDYHPVWSRKRPLVSTYDDDVEETCLTKKMKYTVLSEEPKVDKKFMCRVAVRLPDGSRVEKSFLRVDSIRLLWTFCASQLEDSDTKSFRLMVAVPGASKCLDFDSGLTFEESGLANSLITITLD